jgi:hypothetical protein
MANGPTTPAKDVVGDSAVFINFARRLVQVPHSEIKAKLDEEKEAKRTRRTKRHASRASASSASKRAI